MKKFLLTILFLSFSTVIAYAQEDTTARELIAIDSEVKAAEIEQLNEKEEERTQEIANLLGFVLPEYTDNPSYVITFKDPSPDEKGVEIDIDGQSFKKINSPYTFPALTIGQHTVKFRFYDENSNVQLLEYDLIVIPRSPIINSPTLTEKSIEIKGTALANSEVLYTLTANAYNKTGIINADGNGEWSIKVTPEGGLSDGIYTFMAYTRKYGYASNLSDPVTFGVGENPDRFLENDEKEIYFSFSEINKDNIVNAFAVNPDLIIMTAGAFLVGLILATLIKGAIDGGKRGKKEKEVESILIKREKSKDKEEKTLRELLGEKESNEKEEKKEEKKEDTKEKEKSIINKDVFLKKYKHIDPDKDNGKEKDSKEVKKKIKVSLTTKED